MSFPKYSEEPVAIPAAIQTLIAASVGLGQAFGWFALDSAQNGAVMTAYAALVGVWAAFTRQKVTPYAE